MYAKGRAGRTEKELEEVVSAWKETGILLSAQEFGAAKPALYTVYKLLLV